MQPWMEAWTQPVTAPQQPELEGDPAADAGGQVDRNRWIADPAARALQPKLRRRRLTVMDVIAALVVIALLLAVLVALPLLLLGRL
jgi:hypothetical protein